MSLDAAQQLRGNSFAPHRRIHSQVEDLQDTTARGKEDETDCPKIRFGDQNCRTGDVESASDPRDCR
nr:MULTISPECIES: hypothetical protein [unclassified Rhodococcus (in: high G+C Gram-positive bacteria)]